jgi:catechol 2,3-dioxygenase-like lactoylglutathione lyase family enzyme
MIHGVSHVGIGVGDMEKALAFYGGVLGFEVVVFDYTGRLAGIDSVESAPKARIVMLRNENSTPIAQGMLELVQMLPPEKPNPHNIEFEWGNIGIAEVCQDVKNLEEISKIMTDKGFKVVMPVLYAILSGEEVKYCYFRSPERVLLELIEWHMYKEFGGTPTFHGINHLAIGVSDIEGSTRFYRDIFGFKEVVFDCADATAPPLTESPPPAIHENLLANGYRGAWIELFQHYSPYKPGRTRPRWGDIGLMEFAIHVSNIEKECELLKKKGAEFISPIQTVQFSSSEEWKYAYVREPDGIRLSIVEH